MMKMKKFDNILSHITDNPSFFKAVEKRRNTQRTDNLTELGLVKMAALSITEEKEYQQEQ